jgi:hypothetical protein
MTKTGAATCPLTCKTTLISAEAIMESHNWQQSRIEHAHLYQGYLTVVQFYRCRHCGQEVGLPDGPMRPEKDGCPGLVKPVKHKWRAPIKERKDVTTRTYPAKKKTSTKSGGWYETHSHHLQRMQTGKKVWPIRHSKQRGAIRFRQTSKRHWVCSVSWLPNFGVFPQHSYQK